MGTTWHGCVLCQPSPTALQMPIFFNPETQSFRTSGTYKLYPTHCKNPSILKACLTLQAVNELYQALTQQKLRHTKALDYLINIITNSTPLRVVPRHTPPLETVAPARVNATSTSVNPTVQNNIFKTKLIH